MHLFADSREVLTQALKRLRTRIRPDAAIWVSWPKQASKVPTDITEDSIREVIAFPKNNKGADLMAQSPCEIGLKELRDVYVQITYKKKAAE